jgi:hypothetical protein
VGTREGTYDLIRTSSFADLAEKANAEEGFLAILGVTVVKQR